MEKFEYKGEVVGFKISTINNGSLPITDGKEPLQIVTLKHPKGGYLKAHRHEPKQRTTESLQECIIVKSGKIKLDLYGTDHVLFGETTLEPGQLFALTNGGYGIHILEDAEMFEVKNGPFVEDKILIADN